MIVITVRAEGFAARLAHDIRIEASGDIAREGDRVRATFPLDRLRVIATSRHATEEWHPPSPKDAREIEDRTRKALKNAVAVDATKDAIVVNGKQTVKPRDLDVGDGRVRGTCTLSLAALGIEKVAGPLGAVRTADAIDIQFDIEL